MVLTVPSYCMINPSYGPCKPRQFFQRKRCRLVLSLVSLLLSLHFSPSECCVQVHSFFFFLGVSLLPDCSFHPIIVGAGSFVLHSLKKIDPPVTVFLSPLFRTFQSTYTTFLIFRLEPVFFSPDSYLEYNPDRFRRTLTLQS